MRTQNTKSGKPVPATKPTATHIMVTLSSATRHKIEKLAKQENRSMSYLCRRFIEQGLNAKKSPTKK